MPKLDNNGDRIWGYKKTDVLFVVGVGVIVYGAITVRPDVIWAGIGVFGIALFQRGDK